MARSGIGCRELAQLAASRRRAKRQAVRGRRLWSLQGRTVVIRAEAVPGRPRHGV